MRTDGRVIAFIRQLREQYGRVGKEKLKILLDAYCTEEGIVPLKASTIGKVVKRHNFFFEGTRVYRKRRPGVLRVKKAPKEQIPGYVEMDTVIIHVAGKTVVFITAIDVVTKYAACLCASTKTSLRAKHLLMHIQQTYCFPIRMIQTDNGSEFLGEFEAYCQAQHLPHLFTYPRSPKINGGVERFNRTIQEEFINRCSYLLEGPHVIADYLVRYLSWYNGVRPHHSLGLQSPNQYIHTLQSNM